MSESNVQPAGNNDQQHQQLIRFESLAEASAFLAWKYAWNTLPTMAQLVLCMRANGEYGCAMDGCEISAAPDRKQDKMVTVGVFVFCHEHGLGVISALRGDFGVDDKKCLFHYLSKTLHNAEFADNRAADEAKEDGQENRRVKRAAEEIESRWLRLAEARGWSAGFIKKVARERVAKVEQVKIPPILPIPRSESIPTRVLPPAPAPVLPVEVNPFQGRSASQLKQAERVAKTALAEIAKLFHANALNEAQAQAAGAEFQAALKHIKLVREASKQQDHTSKMLARLAALKAQLGLDKDVAFVDGKFVVASTTASQPPAALAAVSEGLPTPSAPAPGTLATVSSMKSGASREVALDGVKRERIDLQARRRQPKEAACNASGGAWKGNPHERLEFIPGFDLEAFLDDPKKYILRINGQDYPTAEDCFEGLRDTGVRYYELLRTGAGEQATEAELRRPDSPARKAAKDAVKACPLHGTEFRLLGWFRSSMIERIKAKWPEMWKDRKGETENGHGFKETCGECGNKVAALYAHPDPAMNGVKNCCGTCRKRIKNKLTLPARESAAVGRAADDAALRLKMRGAAGGGGGKNNGGGGGKKGKGR